MEAALAQAGSTIPSREAGQAFFKLLFTILKNVSENPSEPKYRSVKLANKGFQSKVGQFAGGVDAMKALGFAETEDGRLELQLVWGLPDAAKLRSGYEAMCKTAAMLGVDAPPIDFSAAEGSAPAAAAAAAPPPPVAAAAAAPPVAAPPMSSAVGGGAVRTFNVRDSRKYQVGTESTFRSRDGAEVAGMVLSLAPLSAANPDAPYAAKATVLIDEEQAAPPGQYLEQNPLLNLNAETRLAPSGWYGHKRSVCACDLWVFF